MSEEKVLGHLDLWFTYNATERWIGLRKVRKGSEKEEGWKNRKGTEITYLFNFLPTLGIVFSSTRWKPIKESKKKK